MLAKLSFVLVPPLPEKKIGNVGVGWSSVSHWLAVVQFPVPVFHTAMVIGA